MEKRVKGDAADAKVACAAAGVLDDAASDTGPGSDIPGFHEKVYKGLLDLKFSLV